MNDEERLERIESVLERLDELSRDHVIVIEGVKDRRALNAVGIFGDMFLTQCSGGPVAAAEYVETHGGRAVVLTDWDRKGDLLAERIAELLPGGPSTDLSVRGELANLCSPYIKDVESLDTLVRNLRELASFRWPASMIIL